MISTFMGLETAKRGLNTSQSALYTMSQNVANANTPGYTRQRVNFAQTTAFPTPGMNSPMVAGQLGTGVQAESVQRVRESFLDVQFRNQANKVGYYGTLSESLVKMEEIMNEPTDSGLQATLDKFWKSLQDLSANTENSGARAVVAANGQMVADTLNYYYNSLTSVQKDIGRQIDVKQNEINTILDNIHKVNVQISEVEPNGYLPNDLYDKRDALVDSLSQLVNIKVTNVTPTDYGNAKPIAEGLYNIEMITKDGQSYIPPVNLVSVNKSGILGIAKVEVTYDQTTTPKMVDGVKFGDRLVKDTSFSGQLAGLIESYGYIKTDGVTTSVVGRYPDMLQKLNNMTEAFVNEFNKIHREGFTLNEKLVQDPITGEMIKDPDPKFANDFFVFEPGNAAQSIKVNDDIRKDPGLIAAGGKSGASADNENAQKLAALKKLNFSEYSYYQMNGNTLPDGLTGSLDSFYSGLIGGMGVDSQGAEKNYTNSIILANSVDYNRQSVSAVSLDEEMTDMIRFQQAYNASSRVINMMDEMLDKIVNGLGTGGR
ncbi:flagellar hook-associated protein FlgK [Peribacillus loiseleuriae]|uniref:Flagellar hook-associated protein 1 n=1 Tax=Peribacillus loiseleuriae TaxID=1679170 RepID=A0A0K9GZ25_9BACI|nr:flagellar hook-associated protein FlgK [Peribacillus loiseleuriae]KMY51850.1 flagellar hook protein FlgK [Peribacillus loiseleuriae]